MKKSLLLRIAVICGILVSFVASTLHASQGTFKTGAGTASSPCFALLSIGAGDEAEVAPWEAVLGASISVPTLNGHVNIKVPPGTQNGQKLRVRGRGLPQRGGVSGDLIVETRIEVPKQVTDSERKVWEQLARESRFNPRE
jgi:hypothetical protein